MKICFVTPIYPIVSDPRLGIFVHEQAKDLVKEGNEIHVLTFGKSEDKSYEVKDGVKIYRIRLNRLFFVKSIWTFLAISKKIAFLNKKHDFDIINSHFVNSLSLLTGILTKILRKPFIITAYGIGVVSDKLFKRVLIKASLSFASRVVCVSNYIAKLTSNNTSKEKIVMINLGVDESKLKPSMSVNAFKKKWGIKDEKVLLSIAGLVKRKGIDTVMNSLPEVVKVYPNIKYFVIGRGSEKEKLRKMAKQYGLEKKVVFIDYVGQSDLANFYNICDIFILMSRTIKEKSGIEGLGKVYLEASYFGKAVIGGKSGGTGDAIIDGKTGYRVEPGNRKRLTQRIIALLKNDVLRNKIGDNGKKLVKTKLLGQHYAKRLTEVCRSLIES